MKINMVRVEVVGDVRRLAGPGLRRFLRVVFVALDVASRRWRPLSLFVRRRRGGGVEASRAWRGRPSLHVIAASRSRAFTPPARHRRDRRRRTVRTIGSPGDDAVDATRGDAGAYLERLELVLRLAHVGLEEGERAELLDPIPSISVYRIVSFMDLNTT